MAKQKKPNKAIVPKKKLTYQRKDSGKRRTPSPTQESQYTRSLIEASLDPLVTISVGGKILDVNEASIKVTGIPRQKLIGTNFSNYFTEPDKAQKGYLRAFRNGFVADYALTIKHKNGNLTDVLYNASVYKDDKGNVLGVFAAARDVTEQKWAKDLRIANIELAFQNNEKEKRAAELIVANKELSFQNEEKEKRAAELSVANKELAFQNEEKEKRAAELSIANKELHFQNNEKENRAAELIIANKELSFQNNEKEKRAAELGIANKELAFQSEEKEKRAAELIVANKELSFQNEEKEKRAAELSIANKELHFQNNEKENRAAELIVANKELSFQNEEKEKRAAELGIANTELAFQNQEKENRAAELGIANKELAFQSEEKEKRAIELIAANKELQSFAYVSSHDLQEPLRKIQTFTNRIIDKESATLSETGRDYFQRIQGAAKRMQTLIEDLLAFSRVNAGVQNFENTSLTTLLDELINDFKETIDEKGASIEIGDLGTAYIIPFQFRQLMQNLIGNALKFSKSNTPAFIKISSKISKGNRLTKENVRLLPGKLSPEKNYNHIKIADNGIGFEPRFQEQVFEVFQRLHGKEEYAGTGIGLAIVKKIVENHNGVITATSELGQGATFDIYIPE